MLNPFNQAEKTDNQIHSKITTNTPASTAYPIFLILLSLLSLSSTAEYSMGPQKTQHQPGFFFRES